MAKICLDYVTNSSSSSFVFGEPQKTDWDIHRVGLLFQEYEGQWLNTIREMDRVVKQYPGVWEWVRTVRDGWDDYDDVVKLYECLTGRAFAYTGVFLSDCCSFHPELNKRICELLDAVNCDPCDCFFDAYTDRHTISYLERLLEGTPENAILTSGNTVNCQGLSANNDEAVDKQVELIRNGGGLIDIPFWYSDTSEWGKHEKRYSQYGEEVYVYENPETEYLLNHPLSKSLHSEISREEALDYLKLTMSFIHKYMGQVVIVDGRDGDGGVLSSIQYHIADQLKYGCVHMG